MRIKSLAVALLLTGCSSVPYPPGKDRIITIDSVFNGSTGPIQPMNKPIDIVEYVPADQSWKSKISYTWACMENYSWGRGWTDTPEVNQ
jgi:hypothetical protein